MPRSRKQLIALYGSDYPESVVFDGIRMSLVRENRFLRVYEAQEPKIGTIVSRFMDGTAEISLAELREQWPDWSHIERHDFTTAVAWLSDHPELPDMLRFILESGGPDEFSTVAAHVARDLPIEEAFERLSRILDQTPIGRAANIIQAISLTKHPDAGNLLRQRLRATLDDPRLMEPDDFLNWVAYDAICNIEHLLEIGAPAAEFEQEVRRLIDHPSKGATDWTRRRLSKWYAWLSKSNPQK